MTFLELSQSEHPTLKYRNILKTRCELRFDPGEGTWAWARE